VFGPLHHFPAHYDTTDKAVVAIYYVNDSDGETLFFNKKDIDGVYKISHE
jgi:hypothetical protein